MGEPPNTRAWTDLVQGMFRDLVSGVSFLHERHICHLDLSLENVMLMYKNKAKKDIKIKIIDFGVAKHFRQGSNFKIKGIFLFFFLF